MNNYNRKFNDGGEIQTKIDRMRRVIDNPNTDAKMKADLEAGIKKLEALLKKDEPAKKDEPEKKDEPAKKDEEKKPMVKRGRPVKKDEPKKDEEKKPMVRRGRPAKKDEPKKDEPVKKDKGLKVLSTKRVTIDGKEVDMNSKEFCDYLLAEFRARRQKAEENKGKRKKTKSVMAKVVSNVATGLSTAIKSGIKENKVAINKNPQVFIGKVEKLETATKSFFTSLKEVLGEEYDAKDVKIATDVISELVSELKKKVADKK